MSYEKIHEDRNGVYVLPDSENPGHTYTIFHGVPPDENPLSCILFQNGPIKNHGINGVTSEALIAILIDRLIVLNEKFPCEENEAAIASLQEALEQMEKRTRNRIKRGVEGLNQA